MASLRKKPGSRFWWACFSLPSGERVQRSTKTTKKSDALQIALGLEEAARHGKTASRIRALMEEVCERITKTKELREPAAGDWLSSWVATKAAVLSPSSGVRYRQIVQTFVEFLGDSSKEPLRRIEAGKLAGYRDAVAKSLSPASANQRLKVLKSAFSEAFLQGLVSENIGLRVKPLRGSKSESSVRRRAFTVEEVHALLDAAKENREWHSMILVALYSGQRLGDIAKMDWKNIEEGGWWRFRSGKTGANIALPLPLAVIDSLGLPQPKGPVFPKAHKLAVRTGTLSNQFHSILAKAGLVEKRNHSAKGQGRSAARAGSEISFHSLRHTTTTWLKEAGVGEAVAMQIVGHETKAVSRNYTHIPESAILEAVNKLPLL